MHNKIVAAMKTMTTTVTMAIIESGMTSLASTAEMKVNDCS